MKEIRGNYKTCFPSRTSWVQIPLPAPSRNHTYPRLPSHCWQAQPQIGCVVAVPDSPPIRQCPRCDARFRGDISHCPIDGVQLCAPSDPFIGRTVAGRYLVLQELGSGGMGAVYRARHQVIGRDVALKFLDPALTQNERQRKRFLGEARAANQIDHEHIIDITDFGETEDGLVYMVMEYLEGRTLEQEIDAGALAVRRALRIATQVALGLARAHDLGVVHRDIKPANIFLVRKRADSDFVKVLDFGVARIEQDIRITGQGTIVGTPEYIAPEQIRSALPSSSADLYSLGCVLFEMLTQRLPFEGKTTALLVKHLNDAPPIPSTLNSAVPPAVDRLVLRLLDKDPSQRYRDAHHLVEELQNLLDILPANTTGSTALTSSMPAAEVYARRSPPDEDETWAKTLERYRAQAAEAHPTHDMPSWLVDALARSTQLAAEIRELRTTLRSAAERATRFEETRRAPRTQIGHALNELTKDESRVSRQLAALQDELKATQVELYASIDGMLLSFMTPASPDERLGKLSDELSVLSRHRSKVKRVSTAADAIEAEHRDLVFQISELKGKLSSIHATSTVDHEIMGDELRRLDATLQSRLAALSPLAERMSSYFATHPRFQLEDAPPAKKRSPSGELPPP
jgi:eukaryotic-like serine/threonine-protein kinase